MTVKTQEDPVFVVYMNKTGFMSGNGSFSPNIAESRQFASRESANSARLAWIDENPGFGGFLSILEWT